jgi:hypothetical protein
VCIQAKQMAEKNDEHWQEMTSMSRTGQQKRHLSYIPVPSITQIPPVRQRRTASEQTNTHYR